MVILTPMQPEPLGIKARFCAERDQLGAERNAGFIDLKSNTRLQCQMVRLGAKAITQVNACPTGTQLQQGFTQPKRHSWQQVGIA